MARIRSIKPDFWTSEQVMECSPITRLLFVGMWNFADDHGRLPNAAKTLKAQIFPGDDISSETVRGMVDELSSNGLLQQYSVDGKDYLWITGWHHQKIDKRQAAKHPEPPPITEDHSSNVRRTVSTDLRGSERKGSDRTGEHSPEPKTVRTKYSDEFENQFWKPYPRTPTMSKPDAWKQWMRMTPDDRISACKAIEPYRRYLKQNPTLQTVHACRFLSQERFAGFEQQQSQSALDIRSSLI